jgi:3-oxoacyl-[acyl-carrier protein] reductase
MACSDRAGKKAMAGLRGKVAVVTGASKGIGAALARAFARHGATTILNYASDRQGAERIVADIAAEGGIAHACRADVSQPAEAAALIAFAVERGGLDILVNNAGIYRLKPFETITPEDFRRIYEVNVLGPLLTMQAAAAHLPHGGAIVNVATNGISTLSPGGAAYTSSKAALVTMSQVIARELGPRGIRVNVVCPGATETEGSQPLLAGTVVQRLVAGTPLGRVGQPEDIVGPVLFLASDAARWVTGEVVFASGGLR